MARLHGVDRFQRMAGKGIEVISELVGSEDLSQAGATSAAAGPRGRSRRLPAAICRQSHNISARRTSPVLAEGPGLHQAARLLSVQSRSTCHSMGAPIIGLGLGAAASESQRLSKPAQAQKNRRTHSDGPCHRCRLAPSLASWMLGWSR